MNRYFLKYLKPVNKLQEDVKHPKRQGILIWDSYNKGTYVKSKHGELK